MFLSNPGHLTFDGLPTRYLPSIGLQPHPAFSIHHLKSYNYRAVRPKPLPPPPISRLFSRPPVRWLLMADTHRQAAQTEANYVKHRLLLVKSPWQVTGRAGQSSPEISTSTDCETFTAPKFTTLIIWLQHPKWEVVNNLQQLCHRSNQFQPLFFILIHLLFNQEN